MKVRTSMNIFEVVVMVVQLSLVSAEIRNVTGWCCPERKDGGGGGCPMVSAGYIEPSFLQQDNGSVEVTWETRALSCLPDSSLVYYDNATTILDFLIPDQGEEIRLNYVPFNSFDKVTSEYCVEDNGSKEYRVAVCKPDPEKLCGGGVCVPKCCGEGEVADPRFYCKKRIGSPPFQFYSMYGEIVAAPASLVTVGDSVPDCTADGSFPAYMKEKFHLLVNGKLMETEEQNFKEFNEFCIENSYDDDDELTVVVLSCTEKESQAITIKHDLLKSGYIISDFFLIITILFHVFIKSLRDTQGLIFLSHMVAMLVALTILFILSIASRVISKGGCIFLAFMFQYSYLAMFFWLNIMCFDIWRVIRATAKGIPLSGILSSDVKKLKLYCLYGWGCPLVISIVTAIMHSLPAELAKTVTQPGFGKVTCWLPGDLEHLIYCYAYVAAILILNFLFIGHTIVTLYQAGSAFTCFAREVTVTAFNRKHLEAFWQRFFVFVLMVFSWTTELLSWKIKPREIWIITDWINSLQGFILFLIFISNKKRRNLLKEFMEKAIKRCCPSLSKKVQPKINSQLVTTYNATSPSTSLSGPSGSTEEEVCSQTLRSN